MASSDGYWSLPAHETQRFLRIVGRHFAAEEVRAINRNDSLLKVMRDAAFSCWPLECKAASPLGLMGFWTLGAGEVREFERRISRRFSAEEVRAINNDDETLAKRMCVALANQIYR